MTITLQDWDHGWLRPHMTALAAEASHLLWHQSNVPTILDVGANTGLFTEELLVLLPLARYHLFEPVRRYARHCSKKFPSNPLVTVHEYGLGLSDHTAPIYMDPDNLGWSTLVRSKALPGMDCQDVEIRNFSKHAATDWRIGQVDLIKMDVEGYEHAALQGMLPHLASYPRLPPILLEVGWGRHAHPSWDKEIYTFRSLWNMGYQPFDTNIERTTNITILPA